MIGCCFGERGMQFMRRFPCHNMPQLFSQLMITPSLYCNTVHEADEQRQTTAKQLYPKMENKTEHGMHMGGHQSQDLLTPEPITPSLMS